MFNDIKVFASQEKLFSSFADFLTRDLERIPPDEYYSMALSGGKTPASLFRYLSTKSTEDINWDKILIFWGDERCVDPEDDESNYKMAYDNLLVNVPAPQINIFRLRGEEPPSAEAEVYSGIVETNVPDYGGTPQFDLMILGLGADGHTASIFPENIELFRSQRLFDVTTRPGSKQKRITATGRLINNARTVIFLVTGKSKADVVSAVIHKKPGFELLPASKVSPMSGQLIWMLDTEASSLL